MLTFKHAMKEYKDDLLKKAEYEDDLLKKACTYVTENTYQSYIPVLKGVSHSSKFVRT